MTEITYNGYDNVIEIKVSDYYLGVKRAYDFSTATAIEIILPDIPQTVTAGIDSSVGSGVLRLSLGAAGIPVGTHKARLVAKDATHPNGQILAHEEVHNFRLQVL